MKAMKRILVILFALGLMSGLSAQSKIRLDFDEAKLRLEEYNTERLLDSLDQEKLPKIVSGGLLAGGNLSNFIITRDHQTMSSYMMIGAEAGGFLDFRVTKHFAIQPQVMFTAHQNYFAENDSSNRLWSFGVDIPIYFLGRYGNMEKGYVQFGGGVFTHFTFASNISGKYHNVDEPVRLPARKTEYDYSRLHELHNNHFGVCATVGYEFSFGMQINAAYKVSLSDITAFYSEKKGTAEADALIYPQSVSLTVGYRWR
jgi:hypothetical protein